MSLLVNLTELPGELIIGATNNITGSVFLTLLLIMFFLMFLGLVLRLPLEFTAIILIPLAIVFMSTTSEFLAAGGVILIYLGVLIAKNFMIT